MSRHCPVCAEPARLASVREQRELRGGSTCAAEPSRLRWVHASDGEPLCPEMTTAGYQPATPIETED